jgi:hypothetical protein
MEIVGDETRRSRTKIGKRVYLIVRCEKHRVPNKHGENRQTVAPPPAQTKQNNVIKPSMRVSRGSSPDLNHNLPSDVTFFAPQP